MKLSSVLKGMKPRVSGNIQAKEVFNEEEKKNNIGKMKEKIEDKKKEEAKKKKFENQAHQIKVSERLKNELNALKTITKTKYDYEILELLVDSFNKNELTPPQRRKFRAMTEDDFF